MADTSVHHIQTSKTGRYFTLGTLGNETQHIWLVLHGYGQLAEYFLRNFQNIQHSTNFFVAPEALNKFYLNQTTGRIGATWMTKEDREYEIEDYVAYLDNILDSIDIPSHCNIHVLGFSQGSATACRWVFHTQRRIKTLVCWAGFFPPDMQWNSAKYLGDEMKTYLLYGNKDEYVNEDLLGQMEKVMATLKKKPNIITFEGKHEILEPTLYTLCKSVENG